MGGGSGCIVGKIMAGRNSLRMTDSGSRGIESCGPRCTNLQSASICTWSLELVLALIKADVYIDQRGLRRRIWYMKHVIGSSGFCQKGLRRPEDLSL